MTVAIADRARQLTAERRPFVHATVVRAQAPTSAQPGDAAVILADGSIEGFVGGSCAETSVRAAALDTLRDGNTLLLRVLPSAGASFPEAPGALVVVNPCLSGGAIEIFLRPVLPRPLLAVAGATTPIGQAVAELATFLDFDLTPPSTYAGAAATVVATLGHGDEDAIRAALAAGVPLIALVASRTRGAAVLDALALTPEERSRVRPHAGLDIGARTHKEIALSILAEIVAALRTPAPSAAPGHATSTPASTSAAALSSSGKLSLTDISGISAPGDAGADGDQRSGGPQRGPAAATTAARTAVDPVCGMTVVVGADTPHAVVGGVEHWFCCAGCRDRFAAA